MWQLDDFDNKILVVHPHEYTLKGDQIAASAASIVGACLGDEQVIIFDPTIAAGQLRETLLHEAIHAIIGQTNIRDVTFGDADDTDKEEEKLVRPLAARVLALLRDNPWLTDFLIEGTGYRIVKGDSS